MSEHTIAFELRPVIAIGILEEMSEWGMIFTEMGETSITPTFYISLSKEDAPKFVGEFCWAMSMTCDMDQDEGENYLIPDKKRVPIDYINKH